MQPIRIPALQKKCKCNTSRCYGTVRKSSLLMPGRTSRFNVSINDLSAWDVPLTESSTSDHSYRSANHATLRGYNDAGFLRFSCHLTHHPTTDQAWRYRVNWKGMKDKGRTMTMTTYQCGVTVETQTLMREPKNRFIQQNLFHMSFPFLSLTSLYFFNRMWCKTAAVCLKIFI